MRETLKNLCKAYVGECQARMRYSFYAKVAKNEGYEQIAEIFLITADNEKEHAKRLFEHIQKLKGNEKVKIDNIEVPVVYNTTVENLKTSIKGEDYEFSEMYPFFADVAEKEDEYAIAKRFRAIAKAEEHHKERYKLLLKQVEQGAVFKKSDEVYWMCRKCGYVHYGKEAPEDCPSCDHSRAYFQVKYEDYFS